MSRAQDVRIFPFPLLTRRGFMLLACGACIPLAGVAAAAPLGAQGGLLSMFLGVCAGLAFWEHVQCRRILRRLTLEFEAPAFILSDREETCRLNVRCGPGYAARLRIRPEIPAGTVAPVEMHTVLLTRAGGEQSIRCAMRAPGRGEIRWERLEVRLTTGLALTAWQLGWRLPEPVVRTVYPNAQAGARQALRAFQQILLGEQVIETAGGEGREFDSLRAYAIGDDLRRVDWKRSARGSGLLVRRYRPETHQRITIAIDCGRRMGNRLGERLQLDYAADGAAHLLKLADEHEDEVGLFAFDRTVLAKVPCGKGARQERHIMEALVKLKASGLEADYQLLTEWAHFNKRRSLFVLLTSVANPVALDTLRAALLPVRRKHLPLICALADRDLQQLTEERAANATQAYIIAAAMQQLEAIQGRLQALQKSGIDCIYCTAAGLAAALHRKYFELKLSGRL